MCAARAARLAWCGGLWWLVACGLPACTDADPPPRAPLRALVLPMPATAGEVSVEEALSRRRSVRAYAAGVPSLADIAQILWAAQGVTDAEGRRTAPSAGSSYPLELYVATGGSTDLPVGVYRYRATDHALDHLAVEDARAHLVAAAGQEWLQAAPVVIVIAAASARTQARYGAQAERHVHVEAGHAAQNIYLQCVPRGLGTVFVGGFDEEDARAALSLPRGHRVLALMPLGRRDA